MPSSFGQYTGGIQPIQGISEAGGAIGRTYERGVASFSESLANGVQNYLKGTAENDMINQEAQALGMQLKQYHDVIASNPEYAPFAEQLMPYTESLAKIPEMSLAQKRGALNGAKVAFNNIGNQFQMFNAMKQMNEERVAAEAMRPENNPKYITTEKTIADAIRNYKVQGSSYMQNETEFVDWINKLKQSGANIGDTQDAIDGYRMRVRESAQELAKTNPVLASTILDQVDSAVNADYTPTSEEEFKNFSSNVDKASSNIQSKSIADVSEIEQKLKQEKQSLEGLKKQKESGDYVPQGLAGATIETLSNIGQPVSDSAKLSAMLGSAGVNKFLTGTITPEKSKRIAEKVAGFGGLSEIVGIGYKALGANPLFNGIASLAGRELTQKETDLLTDDLNKAMKEKYADGSVQGTGGLLKPNINTQIADKESGIKSLEQQKAELETVSEKDATQNIQLKPSESIGTVSQIEEIPQEVRNQKAIDFMTQRLAYRDANGNLVTPASVNKIFGQLNPTVQTIYSNEGDRIVKVPNDKGGFDTHFVPKKEVTAEELRKQKDSTFGKINPKTGELDFKPLAIGSPFEVKGKWTGDSKQLDKFKEISTQANLAFQSLDQAEEIIRKHPVAMKNPFSKQYTDVKSLLAQSFAGTRTTLGFTGIMTKYKLDFLKEVLPDPTSLLERPEQSLSKLNLTRQKFGAYLSSSASENGLEFRAPSKYLPPNLGALSTENTGESALREEFLKNK